jgi:hypothetical protein
MRRSGATILGVAAGVFAGVAFLRRRGAQRDRIDLYYEDGAMVSLPDGSPDADRLLSIARDVLGAAR